jgi:hypothetical protein
VFGIHLFDGSTGGKDVDGFHGLVLTRVSRVGTQSGLGFLELRRPVCSGHISNSMLELILRDP